MFGLKILQMRMEHAEEKIDIGGRLRNLENAFVLLLVRKSNAQGQFFCDQIERAQSQGKLLQKTAEHKEEWLDSFNFIFKFEALLERLRRPDQFEQPIGLPVRPLPHSHRFRTEARPNLLLIEGSELPESMNPPLVQNR